MKRIGLTLFFATYYFFMPFVISSCSQVSDQPFALSGDSTSVTPSTSASVDTDDDRLEECQKMEFLIESCIDVLQAESDRISQEQSRVSSAVAVLSEFQTCQTIEDISGETTNLKFQIADDTENDDEVEVVEDTGPDCEAVIADMVSAFQTCEALSNFEKHDGCNDVEKAIDEAVEACDDPDSETVVTDDFCSTLTA